MVSANSASARSGSKRGQTGKSAELAGEIFRPDVGRLQDERDTDDELEQPERRGEIADMMPVAKCWRVGQLQARARR